MCIIFMIPPGRLGNLRDPYGRLGNLREDSGVFVLGHLFFGYLQPSLGSPAICNESFDLVKLRQVRSLEDGRMVRFGWFDFFPPEIYVRPFIIGAP